MNPQKTLIVANWKCNPASRKEAEELFGAVKNGVKDVKNAEVVICPPFVYVSCLKSHVSGLTLGAQNVFYKEKGAFTGEVSSLMLKDLGVEYVIIGHSERRALGETNEVISKKLKVALESGLKPILCIGEKEGENKGEIIEKQLKSAFRLISNFKFKIENLAIAYEPIWAIGTGKNCSVAQTIGSVLLIRKTISKIYNAQVTGEIRILYGGSVNSGNSADYLKKAGVDGLLVGGSSLNADDFIEIVQSAI